MAHGYERWALLPALALVVGSTTSAQEKKEEFKKTAVDTERRPWPSRTSAPSRCGSRRFDG